MFSVFSKILDWIISLFGSIASFSTLRDQNAFLQTKLTETQKELAPFKSKQPESDAVIAQLQTRNAELEQENERLKEQLRINDEGDNLDATAIKIIAILANHGSRFYLQNLKSELRLPEVKVKYSVEQLIEHKFIQTYRAGMTKPTAYGLTQKGRKLALDKNLIEEMD